MEQLKPCPFCGGKAEKNMIGNDYTKSRSVEIICTKCFVKRIIGAIRESHEWCNNIAVEKWNMRI